MDIKRQADEEIEASRDGDMDVAFLGATAHDPMSASRSWLKGSMARSFRGRAERQQGEVRWSLVVV